jgi:hypothetical protein
MLLALCVSVEAQQPKKVLLSSRFALDLGEATDLTGQNHAGPAPGLTDIWVAHKKTQEGGKNENN